MDALLLIIILLVLLTGGAGILVEGLGWLLIICLALIVVGAVSIRR